MISEYRKVPSDLDVSSVEHLARLFEARPSILISVIEVVLDTETSFEREGIELFIGRAFESNPDEAAALADRLLHDEDAYIAEITYDHLHSYATRGTVIDPEVAQQLMKTAEGLGIRELW